MELWIRSQDKRHLIKADYVSIMENNIINVASTGWDYDVAKYKTKERALEILDEIQDIINNNGIENEKYDEISGCYYTVKKKVYEMPED